MLGYRYYCMVASPSAGNIPAGAAAFKVWGSRPYMPILRSTVYGTVDYDRQLTDAEMAYHGLFPANMVQQPIMIREAV